MSDLSDFLDEPPEIRKGQLLDDYCKYIVSKNKNMLLPWWLMACYAYYELDQILLSDTYFEFELAEQLKKNYPKITHHHKSVIEKHKEQMLDSNGKLDFKTAFMIKEWPERVAGATKCLLKKIY